MWFLIIHILFDCSLEQRWVGFFQIFKWLFHMVYRFAVCWLVNMDSFTMSLWLNDIWLYKFTYSIAPFIRSAELYLFVDCYTQLEIEISIRKISYLSWWSNLQNIPWPFYNAGGIPTYLFKSKGLLIGTICIPNVQKMISFNHIQLQNSGFL